MRSGLKRQLKEAVAAGRDLAATSNSKSNRKDK